MSSEEPRPEEPSPTPESPLENAESSTLRLWMQHLDRLAKDGTIRINSGETAKTIDSKSEVWTEDAFFDDGSEWRSEAAPKTSPSR
jgi:hypothetical protein